MLNWINTNLDAVQYLTILFGVFHLHQTLNAPYYLKRLFRLKLTKEYKLIDCMPCITFWATLVLTFNPVLGMATYLTMVIIDRKNV